VFEKPWSLTRFGNTGEPTRQSLKFQRKNKWKYPIGGGLLFRLWHELIFSNGYNFSKKVLRVQTHLNYFISYDVQEPPWKEWHEIRRHALYWITFPLNTLSTKLNSVLSIIYRKILPSGMRRRLVRQRFTWDPEKDTTPIDPEDEVSSSETALMYRILSCHIVQSSTVHKYRWESLKSNNVIHWNFPSSGI
jgi:hypothetical protein